MSRVSSRIARWRETAGRLAVCALSIVAAASSGTVRGEERIVNVSQGTNISVALFPDGESLVVDLLGRLWRLPATGGGATQLTPDDEAARHPRVAPDGRLIVYERLVNGQRDIWLLDVETGERVALVESEHDDREPDFTADGRSVVFSSNRTGHFCLWRIDLETGVLTQLTAEPGDASFPTASEHGEIAYVRREPSGSSLRALLPTGVSIELYRTSDRLSAPSWRAGGGVIVFNEQRVEPRGSMLKMLVLSDDPVVKTLTRNEDVFESRAAWASPAEYYYTADGRIWRRGIAHVTREPVHLFAAVTVEAASPPSIDTALDAPGPHPALGHAGIARSADGRTEVVAALGDLWLVERRGRPRRLTDDAFVDAAPTVSPRGDFAVFASDRGGNMDLWRVDLSSGALVQLTRSAGKAHSPAISPDGTRVAFIETRGFDPASDGRLRLLHLDSNRVQTLADGLGGAKRPRWDGDARITVEIAAGGTQTLVSFDAASGRPIGPVEAVADQPEPAPEPVLAWQPAAPDEPYVIQVGRLFDGIRSDYRRHVDIHIEGQRIKAIVARGMLPLPERVIDVRDGTVIPGLIDVHAHQTSILGERLGRAWLAYGVTTVREVTDDVDAALERAESWASGRRLGPRLIVSPARPDDASTSDAGQTDAVVPAVPIARLDGLRPAPALFVPSTASPLSWLAVEHERRRSAGLLPTSPLGLSYEDVLSTIIESRAGVMTSLAAAGGIKLDARAVRRLLAHPTFGRIYRDEERARWLEAVAPTGSLEALQRQLARLVHAGGLVAVGSEAPAIPYGLGIHLEMALLADADIPPDQVLRIATASNALALGLERQLGTIEEGKLADLVVVDGNPLVDVGDALNVVAVVRGGVWIDSATLLR